MRSAPLAASLLLVAPLLASAADIYRWRDGKGQVHFSEVPPAGVVSEKVEPMTDSGAGSSPNREELHTYSGATDEERAAQAQQEGEQNRLLAEKRGRCRQAQERLARLATRPPARWAIRDESGQPSRMTEEQYKAEQDKARRAMEENCEKSS